MRRHCSHSGGVVLVCPVLSAGDVYWSGLPSRQECVWASTFSPASWRLNTYFGPDGAETLIYSDLGITGTLRDFVSGYTIAAPGRYQIRLVANVAGGDCAEYVLATHTY